jgi:hypothetical protein
VALNWRPAGGVVEGALMKAGPATICPIRTDLISPAGVRWPNRNDCWPQQATERMVPPS